MHAPTEEQLALKERPSGNRGPNHIFLTASETYKDRDEFEELMENYADYQPEAANIFYTNTGPDKLLPIKAAKLTLADFMKHMESKNIKDPERFMKQCPLRCEQEAHPFGSLRYCSVILGKPLNEIKALVKQRRETFCLKCLTPQIPNSRKAHDSSNCPLKKWGCSTCHKHGEPRELQETHLSWACQRHSGIEELVDTLAKSENATSNSDKVLLTASHYEPSQTNYTQEDEIYDTSEEEVILMTQALILDEPNNNPTSQAEPQQVFHTEHEAEEDTPGLDIDHWTQIFYNSEAAMRENKDHILTTSGENGLSHTSPEEAYWDPTETDNGEGQSLNTDEALNNLQSYNNEIWGPQIFFQDSDFTDGSDIEDAVHSTVFNTTTSQTTQPMQDVTNGISKELVKTLLNMCAFSPLKCNLVVTQVLLLTILVIPFTWGAGLSNQFDQTNQPKTQTQKFIQFHRASDISNNLNTHTPNIQSHSHCVSNCDSKFNHEPPGPRPAAGKVKKTRKHPANTTIA